MSKQQWKVAYCRMNGIDVVEKRGWTRKARSQAKKKLSEQTYIDFMKHIGWESII